MPGKKDIAAVKYIGNRLKERSTWFGLFTLLALFGITPAPVMVESISTLGPTLVGAVFGIFAAITPDKAGPGD